MAYSSSYQLPSFNPTGIVGVVSQIQTGTAGAQVGTVASTPTSNAQTINQEIAAYYSSQGVNKGMSSEKTMDEFYKSLPDSYDARMRPGSTRATAATDIQDTMRAIAMGTSSIPNVIDGQDIEQWTNQFSQGNYSSDVLSQLTGEKGSVLPNGRPQQGFFAYIGDGKYQLTMDGLSWAASMDVQGQSVYRKEEHKRIAEEKQEVANLANTGTSSTHQGGQRIRDPNTGELVNSGGPANSAKAAEDKAKQEAEAGKQAAGVGGPTGDTGDPTGAPGESGNTGDSAAAKDLYKRNEEYLGNLDAVRKELQGRRIDVASKILELKNSGDPFGELPGLEDQLADIDSNIEGLTEEEGKTQIINQKIKDGKFGLDDLKNVLTAVGAGVSIWDAFKGTDDININVGNQLKENLAAMTDKDLRGDMKQAQYEDQPEFGYMEQLAKHQEMFGDPTVDVFGGEQGDRMESEYNLAKLTDDDLTKEEFMGNWIRENPDDPYAQELNQKFSAMGQIGRATEEYGQIGRDETLRNVGEASRFYQSKEAGGLGYTAEQFRSPDMQKSIDYALGRAFGKEATDLRERRYEEFQKGGVLGEETLSALQQSAFKGVDPSLQAQTKFGGGGLAKAVLGTEMATRQRRREGEGDLLQTLQAERAYAPALAGIMQANTPDPLTIMGVNSVSPGAGASVYGQAGEIGTAMYDPTNAYSSSTQQQSLMADMFNQQYGAGLGEQIGDIAEGMGTMKKSIDELLGNA